MKATNSASIAVLGTVLCATALLSACGGGGSDGTSDDMDSSKRRAWTTGTRTTETTPTVVLNNLPSGQTTATSASIGYTLSGGGTVHCRRDGYTPIVCPNPFDLGTTAPLEVGSHTVDFFVDTGTGINTASPAASYTWQINATATATPTSSTTTPTNATTTPPTTASALGNLYMPANLTASGVSLGSWDGSSLVLDTGGNTILSHVADPKGSSKMVNLHRISRTGSLIWGGVRAETTWPKQGLVPGNDYWMAFAAMMKPDEAIVPNTADDAMLVFQTHTPAPGATQPDIALFWRGQSKSIYWQVAYNTYPSNTWNYVGGSNPDTQGTWKSTAQPMPAAGVWTRFIVHYRPGFTSSHNPLVEIWSATPGNDYTKIVNYTGFNTYNSLSGPSYPRIGLYKWTSSAWNTNSLGFYLTPLHFGQGANLYDSAKASLAGF